MGLACWRMRVLLATVLVGCSGVAPVHFSGPTTPAVRVPCTAPVEPPRLSEVRFISKVEGSLELIRASGDARLSSDRGFVSAWSPDSQLLAFADASAVSVWRADDGQLLDLVRCTPGHFGANEVAISADARWVVASGVVRDRDDAQVTCIIDRSDRSATLLPGGSRRLSFSSDGTRLVAEDRTIDLVSKLDVEPTVGESSKGKPQDLGLGVTPDGRYWVRQPSCDMNPLGSHGAWSSSGEGLALVERETGKVKWEVPEGCSRWRISPGGRFVEGWRSSATYVYRASTGARIEFPGGLHQIAPDDQRVLVQTTTGPQIWSVDPPTPLVAPVRYRKVLERSHDGRVSVVEYDQQLALERASSCHVLDWPFSDVQARFTQDDEQLYVGHRYNNRSLFNVWRVRDAALLNRLQIDGFVHVYPMPEVGRVGIGVDGGIRLFDALSGAPLAVAKAPRTSRTPFDENGRSTNVRDHAGERADKLTFVAADSDGRHVVGTTGLGASVVTIWDLEEPSGVVDLPIVGTFGTVAYSPDERFLAAGNDEGLVYLWRRDGTAVPPGGRLQHRVVRLAFSPDGAYLAGADVRGGILVLSTHGARLGSVVLESQHATYLWWTPDGKHLQVDTTRQLRYEFAVR